MACGACRQRRDFVPTKVPSTKTPCHTILEAGDTLVLEVTVSGKLIPKGPYASPGYGLSQALTILGCQGHTVKSLKEIEMSVIEALTDPMTASKFNAALSSRLTTLAQIKKALRSVQT